ncbi:MFS transporter [Solicola sp. PLA-1-18]|uniref:MFS transporter n=1 Tax=Solicola sp. PLA-1-18 TaxID=3380532 RepID=UPI003B800C76
MRRRSYRTTFAVLTVSVMSYALVQSMTVPTLPLLQTELGTTQSAVTWVLTAQLLAAAISTPILGRVGDAVGKNRMLVVAVGALAVGSVVAALATHIGVLIGARVIQGVGGGVIPLAFGIIRDEVPEKHRSMAISVVSSLLAVGFGIGIVVAGPILDVLGFHWLFVLPAIVATLAAVAAFVLVPESPVRTPGGVSLLPAVLLAGWLSSFLLAVSQGPAWGWTSPGVLGLLVAAVVLTLAWVRSEQRARVPVVDLTMMRRRPVWAANLVALLVGVSMYASFGFVPQLVQTPSASGWGLGATVTQAGLVMLPSAAATFVAGLVATPLARLFGPKPMVIASCMIGAVGLLSTALVHDTLVQTAIGAGIASVGVGLVFALLANLVVAAVPAEQTGVASGMNANVRTIGGAVGSAMATSIVTAQVLPNGLTAEIGYTVTFVVLAVVMASAGLAGFLVPGAAADRAAAQAAARVDEPARPTEDVAA